MGWLRSFLVACITGILSLFASGYVADLAVTWYQISSFEGGAGYFVVFMALVGGAAGFVVGLITSRAVAARPRPGFSKSLAFSCATVAVLLAAVAGVARLLADVPPEIDGEALFLIVELRWPARTDVPVPSALQGAGYVRLGTATGTIVRKQEDGPLFLDSAHQVDERWIVPGVVGIFTSRGQRVLEFGAGATSLGGFIVPLPAHPDRAQLEWSDWLPHARPGAPPLLDQFTYRFKVARQSEPSPRRCGRTVLNRHDCHLLLQDVRHRSALGAVDVSRPLSRPAAARVGANGRSVRHRRCIAFPAPRG